ncbi:MAG: hypothetical protein DSY77_10285 [Bacteroidetes bacterium]|nr:MAG: hypothetical protein DSY77_10285 [Bacteroidota bacterium]
MNEIDYHKILKGYADKVLLEGFSFDKIRPELEETNLSEEEISQIIKEIDDIVLLNTLEYKVEKKRFKYQKSGIGVLFTLIFFLFYLAYNYKLIEIENIDIGTLIFVLFVVSFFFYRKVKMPKGKFINKNKFKNN